MVDRIRPRTVQSGNVRIAALEGGDPAEPTVVLLHGYPDTKELWTGVLGRLSRRFHVVAYDVRGAGGSSAPRGAAEYDLVRLGDDLLAVVRELCPNRSVHIVGHDWGAIQAWEFASGPRFEAVLASVTAIAGPSLDQVGYSLRALVRRRRLLEALRRLARSYYIVLLCLPGGPTLLWRVLLGVRRWRRLLARRERVMPPPGYPRATLPRDGIRGANLYRRNIAGRMGRGRAPRAAHSPVQLIVPAQDRFIPQEHYELAEHFAPGLRRHSVPGSHWAPLADPALVADLIGRFVVDVESGGAASGAADRRGLAGSGKDSGAWDRIAEHAAATSLTRNPHAPPGPR
ncbi:MAG: alpha/beta fold hydrolase [Actinomycetota bacterium]|nr:alpha/beta fold hydrolase [Actinomycetota bacterium]